MKLVIQIPCYNEAETLRITLNDLPRSVEGFDIVEWLVIDDGSTDDTTRIAKECGVDHIFRLNKNQGLAKAFMAGINEALRLGADIIVNTDADNQYDAKYIPNLVKPILEHKADYVIGARPIRSIKNFSLTKKVLQLFGSWIVRAISGTNLPDAPSGFRAMSRTCALQLNVFNNFTYTLETIIQASYKGIALAWVPIDVNEYLRPSRLIKNIPSYISKSIMTILRIFIVYKSFEFFMSIGIFFFTLGFLLGVRFLYYYFSGNGAGHVQSLILVGVLLGMGFQTGLIAFLADLFAVNRRLLEDIKYSLREVKHD